MRSDALSVVSKLAASPNNVFTRSQAAGHHLDRKKVRRLIADGVLHEPWPNVLIAATPGSAPTWRQRMTAATLKGTVGSHRSGGRLHQFDGLDRFDVTEVSCVGVAPRLPGAVVHRVARLDPCDVVTVDGVRCTNVARTLTDLGSVCGPTTVERALDDVLRRDTNVRWLRETAERLRRPGQSGPFILLDLLSAFERRGTVRGSWFEGLLERCLDHPDLAGLVVQYELRDGEGKHIARFDLAIPEAKLGIEAHSRSHHFSAELEASDEHRDQAAAEVGWDVMYLGYTSLQSPSSVRDRVLKRVRMRRTQLGGCD